LNKVSIFSESVYKQESTKRIRLSKDLIIFLLILSAIFVGLGTAYLIVSGDWLIASVLVFSLPAFIILIRFPYISLIIWLVLSPFLVQTPTMPERMIYWLIHRLLPVVTLTVIFVSSSLRITKRQLPRLGVVEYAMFGYIVVSIASIFLQSNNVSGTLIHFYDRTFIPICFYLIVRLISPGEQKLKLLVPIALYLVLTQVTIGTLAWIAPSLLRSDWLTYVGARTIGSLGSPGVYSTTLIFGGVFLLYAATRMKPGWKRNYLYFSFLASIFGVLITFSRASWLAGILLLLGVFALYPKLLIRLTIKFLPIILILGGAFMVSQIEYAKTRFYSDDSAHSALSRLPVLVAAYRMFEQKPIFGWGYGNFDRYDRQFQGRFGDLVNPVEKDLTSHNVYMTLLAEQGLVGIALVLAPTIFLLLRSFRIRSRLPRSGFQSQKMLIMLWLVVLGYFVVVSFSPMVVVFGLSLQFITLGLIANIVQNRAFTR
jgi:O-antigen ligase